MLYDNNYNDDDDNIDDNDHYITNNCIAKWSLGASNIQELLLLAASS